MQVKITFVSDVDERVVREAVSVIRIADPERNSLYEPEERTLTINIPNLDTNALKKAFPVIAEIDEVTVPLQGAWDCG